MTCSCGDNMSVDANSKEEAITMMKGMMDQAAIDAHCTEKHPGMMMKKEGPGGVDEEIEKKLMPAM